MMPHCDRAHRARSAGEFDQKAMMAASRHISAFTGDSLSTIRRLFADHGRAHWPAYAGALGLMALAALATALSAYLLKPVLNNMVEVGGFATLKYLSLYIACLFVVRGAATYSYLVLLARTGARIVASIQMRLFDHLLVQNMAFFQDRHSTEFMSRLTIAATGIRDTLQLLTTSAGRDLLTLLGLIGVMIIQDPLMSLIALSLMPIGGYGLASLIRSVRLLARRSFDGSAQILEIMHEAIQGLRIVKSFSLEGEMRRRMRVAVDEVEHVANHMSASMAIASPLADLLGGLSIAVVIFYGSWRVSIAHADAGSFFSFIAALLMAYEPAKRLARLNVEIQNGLAAAKLVYEILDRPAAEQLAGAGRRLAVGRGRIQFERVSFAYRDGERVLNALDFIGEAEQTTALVGPSGGGKSTILALLQRFYDPAEGRIMIDGCDIAGADLASLRSQIAFVSQDVFLFRASIAENIALGRLGASQAEIIAAARKAHAHEFILSFAAGYETSVGERGLQLSAGQRQRIAVARAILKDAPILLLDEPTAALDPESEHAIATALRDLRKGRTTIVVAHRLQTVVGADKIHMIENGRVAESGTHAEMIARGGKYCAFFQKQFDQPQNVGSAAGLVQN
jgi:ABC-type multidrug transport system fused ATPase/permease subunit